MRTISVGTPSQSVMTATLLNSTRAVGRETRANMTPVVRATSMMPTRVSTVITALAQGVAGDMTP